MKRCSSCKVEKSLENFTKDSSRPDGKYVYCKTCVKDKQRARYEADPEAVALINKRWADSPRGQELKRAAKRARYDYAGRRLKTLAKYGLTTTEFDALLESQGGTCRFCEATEGDRRGTPLHIDHCHKTGVVRGLLCGFHNRMLGWLGDDPQTLRQMADYLENSLAHI